MTNAYTASPVPQPNFQHYLPLGLHNHTQQTLKTDPPQAHDLQNELNALLYAAAVLQTALEYNLYNSISQYLGETRFQTMLKYQGWPADIDNTIIQYANTCVIDAFQACNFETLSSYTPNFPAPLQPPSV